MSVYGNNIFQSQRLMVAGSKGQIAICTMSLLAQPVRGLIFSVYGRPLSIPSCSFRTTAVVARWSLKGKWEKKGKQPPEPR